MERRVENFLIDCVNCGKQVLVRSKNDTCYWCGKPASKKEVEVMQHKNLIQKHERLEQNREEITKDFYCLGVKATAEKWGFGLSTWYGPRGLRVRWSIDISRISKGKGGRRKGTVVGKKVGGTEAIHEGTAESPDKVDWEQKYKDLGRCFDGYRQAVLDMCGQKVVDVIDPKS